MRRLLALLTTFLLFSLPFDANAATFFFPTQPSRPTLTSLKSRLRIKATPKPTRTPTPSPTATLTPTPTHVQSLSPQTAEAQKLSSIMQQINDYRRQNNLPSVQTDPYTCAFANKRAKEITTGFNHDGFTNRVNNHTLPYPNYALITENIARTSDYKKVVTLWINSAGHAANMRKDTPYVCVGWSGDFYAYEGWRPL